MTRKALIRLVASFSALAVLAAVVAGIEKSGGGTKDVTVTMLTAGPIEVGGDVRSAGVRVGSVKSISLDGRQARVVLTVDDAVFPLHEDASVTIRPANLLGEDYVDLEPGSDSARYTQSLVIPVTRTHVATTVQDLLDTFQAPAAAGLADVVTTAGEGLTGNGAALAHAIAELSASMKTATSLGDLLSGQNEQLARFVTAIDPVASALATGHGSTLDALLTSTRTTLRSVTTEQTALRATIDQLPATLVSAQRTLAQFAGVAQQATPTLDSLRPLTGNLRTVLDELQGFENSANPALTALQPVLDRANALLDQAGPAVSLLRQGGPSLTGAARGLNPISQQLLERHLGGLMRFVRNWALSTNGHDGLSHYFRGVFYVTPSTLKSLVESYLPLSASGATPPKTAAGTTGSAQNLAGTLGNTLNGLLGGLGLAPKAALTTKSPSGALGLSPSQESGLLQQLLGGN